MALRERHGLTLVAAVLDAAPCRVGRSRWPERVALLLGAEGPGLAPGPGAVRPRVTIPMAAGADSLNVATAGAVILFELLRVLDSQAPGPVPPAG